MSPTASNEYKPLGRYLFERIRQLGITHILGVPGDYNLKLLDYINPVDGLEWAGTCNELNAAYAADGYARASGLPGAIVTTYGVGELSALNGVAGAFAENVPMIHIVGFASRMAQKLALPIHHSPGSIDNTPGNQFAYVESAKPYSVVNEVLNDPATAAEQIDHAISEICRLRRPGYIFVPVDMATESIVAENLDKALVFAWPRSPRTDAVTIDIIEAIKSSHNIVVISDVQVKRFGLTDQVTALAEVIGAKLATTIMAKGSIDETTPRFIGVYAGKLGNDAVRDIVEGADLVITVGQFKSDINSGIFSTEVKDTNHIVLHSHYASVKGQVADGVHLSHVVADLLQLISPINGGPQEHPTKNSPRKSSEISGKLTQDSLQALVERSLRSGDQLIIETGSFQMAAWQMKLPSSVTYETQAFYCSIGYALPATFGASLYRKALATRGRTFLIEGDGSAQMTIQELGSIIRHQLPVTIFLINNDGYTIERAIWGPEETYNDICPGWRWTDLFKSMCARDDLVETYKAETGEELNRLIKAGTFHNTNKPQLVEVMVGKFDYPQALQNVVTQTALHARQMMARES